MNVLKRSTDWTGLPDHILVTVLRNLPLSTRNEASKVCKSWNQCFNSAPVWYTFIFWFYMPGQSRYLQAVDRFGHYMKHVYIELDQSVPLNRENACKVISEIAQKEERRLMTFRVKFMGQNPYFYAGKEFVTVLMELFGPSVENTFTVNQITDVDLSGLTVAYDDQLFDTLSQNHNHLEKLNIQNKVIICKVTSTCLLRLIQRCRKLTDLRIYNCSLSEDMLIAFTEADRKPLKHLSIACRREEKYGKEIDGSAWKAVSGYLPELRVTLRFDHTCPFNKVIEVMKPSIPVSILYLETFTYIYDEVRQAASFYCKTLVKMVLETPTARHSPELNSALIQLATDCDKLEQLYIYSVLEQETVDAILALHPKMKEEKTYVLKSNWELI